MEYYLACTILVCVWVFAVTPVLGVDESLLGGVDNWQNSYFRRLGRGIIRQIIIVTSIVVGVWALREVTGYPL